MEAKHNDNVATKVVIPIIPVFARPIHFLRNGNRMEAQTPIMHEAPTDAPSTDSETHC